MLITYVFSLGGTGIQVSGSSQSQEISANFDILGEDLEDEEACSQFEDNFQGPLWSVSDLHLGEYTLVITNQNGPLTLDSFEVSGTQTTASVQGQSATDSSTQSLI